jgi:hypothetical protein
MGTWGSRGLVVAVIAIVAAGLIGTAPAVAGPTKAEKCAAAKFKAAGKKEACLANEAAKEAQGKAPRYAKCEDAFLAAFARAEEKAGAGVCPTEGDAAAVGTLIDGCFADLQAALGGAPPATCGAFPATGQTQCYDGSNAPTDCADVTTSQDGKVRAGAALSYTDNGDGTITDHNTRRV